MHLAYCEVDVSSSYDDVDHWIRYKPCNVKSEYFLEQLETSNILVSLRELKRLFSQSTMLKPVRELTNANQIHQNTELEGDVNEKRELARVKDAAAKPALQSEWR